ncbi:hypothetical protein TSAR_011901 [Trichomalopsis sarcophagae]|uniref:Shavenoid isoform B-like N-terminal domain-containing protein n=1 Tax=Trichomalopsis sarcophagae TaxID=543379 RepID=A0A232F401_9HYME|nr:hypothetical protein TSAR_011901 [Trichomalopsis sarcophagae]
MPSLSFLIFSLSCHRVLQLALADEITVRRQPDGDVFAIPGSCNEACMVLSSNTASPFGSAPSAFNGNYNDSCTCQCNYDLPVFREDLTICVDHIQECQSSVSGYFVSGSGLVERVPYVFLPVQSGQIIHPDAEIKFEGVGSPICVITGVQQVGINGWTELRNISNGEFPLRLYRDEERTFLQASIKEVSFSSDIPIQQGLTSAEYTAIGVSSVILALIYVASICLYLHSRKSRRKASENDEPESGQRGFDVVNVCPSDNEGQGQVKSNPLLSISRHFESDTNSAISEADLADKLLQSESESDVENQVTSAIIHPHEDYSEPHEQNCNAGPIIGERLPEEDVRVIETTVDHGGQHNMPIFPGTQRRKLYFNPAYFERQLLLAPPPAAIEFLLKIREVISIAKHKMAAKRFVPTLNEIPEETSSDRQSSVGRAGKSHRKRANSVQNDSARSLRCSGCPGCSHGSSSPNLPNSRGLTDNGPTIGPISGESRVRAWLEDVKLLDTRWKNLEEERLLLARKEQQTGKVERVVRDVDAESARMSTKSLPPIFREGLNGCINEMFESDECDSSRGAAAKRSTRSVTREPGYLDRQADEIAEWARRNKREHQENAVNASVRRAIENSFKSQLEQLRSEKSVAKPNDSVVPRNSDKPKGRSTPENLQNKNQANIEKSNAKKSKEIEETRVLLDIINGELSARSSSDAKRIMDAVIQELVVAKEKEKATKASDYETDSLEKSKVSRKSSSSPVSTTDDKSSPALSTALPMDEELTMRNAMIDVQISETISTKTNSVVKNHNLPELVPLRPENYALVSEVYVNDGYASPTGSDDDSGPEIQYEPENPGHLTIKVVDSPKNYVKQDDSEYEPDTLDRKPMKLKINGDITYDSQDIVNEVYVDSLERSTQIMLKSKRSFREENDTESAVKPPREYNSLREIYEARLKYQQQQQQQKQQGQKEKQKTELIEKREERDNDGSEKDKDRSDSWRANSCKCTSPLLPRHERRQRKADNQPDVVPKPPPVLPTPDNEAKPPPPPPKMKAVNHFVAKNAQDRSLTGAGNPTTCEEAPVTKEAAPVVGKPPAIGRKPNASAGGSNDRNTAAKSTKESTKSNGDKMLMNEKDANEKSELVPDEVDNGPEVAELVNVDEERRNERRQQYRRFSKWRNSPNYERSSSSRSPNRRSGRNRTQRKSSRSNSRSQSRKREAESENRHQQAPQPPTSPTACTFEDSAYVSSPESTGSRRRLLKLHDDDRQAHRSHSNGNNNWASCTESDESTSGNGANSESGAESIETDSVFFGNFRARAERERLAAANRQRHGHHQNNDRAGGAASGLQQRPINYQAFQIKSRVY